MDELRDIGLRSFRWTALSSALSTDGVPDAVVTADQPALCHLYIRSTGEPGVCCNHPGVINLVDDLQRRQPAAPEPGVPWAAPSLMRPSMRFGLLCWGGGARSPESVRPRPTASWIGWANTASPAPTCPDTLPAPGTGSNTATRPLTRIMAGWSRCLRRCSPTSSARRRALSL